MKSALYKNFVFYLIAFCISLMGCAKQSLNLEGHIDDPAIVELQMHAADYTNWDMQLRVALRHKKVSWRGIMQWMRNKDNFRMRFSDLFGRHLMLIESRADGGAVAIDAEGNRKYTTDPSSLIQSILGVEVPLNDLYYWLFGAPARGEPYSHVAFNEQGLLEMYNQNTWTIHYTAYNEAGCFDLPSNLILSQADTQLWLHIRNRQIRQDTLKTIAC